MAEQLYRQDGWSQPHQENQPLMGGAPPPLPSRNSAAPPLPPRGGQPAPNTAGLSASGMSTAYPQQVFMNPHQAPVSHTPQPTVGATYAVYPSAANAQPAPQQQPMHTAPMMTQQPPQQMMYTSPPMMHQQPPQPMMYSQAPGPAPAPMMAPQQQPVYQTHTTQVTNNPYATQPGPVLMTKPPTQTQNNSLFVASGASAQGLAQTQAPQMQGPHVSIQVISAAFNKPEWAPWVRIRVGSDQTGWSNYGQSKVKAQQNTQAVEWNEMFYLPVKSISSDHVQIEVINKPTQFQMDYSVIGSNDVLVNRLPPDQPQHLVMPLTDRKGTNRGQLTVVVTGHGIRQTVVQAAADPLKTFIRSIFN